MSKIKVYCAYDKLVPIHELKPHPKNRNIHPKEQIERLAEIIKYQGWRYPIKVSKRSGFITSGHGRLQAAQFLKVKSVPVNYQTYTSEAQEYADLIADNSIALWAEMDLEGIKKDTFELGKDFDTDFLGLKDFQFFPDTPVKEEKTPEEDFEDEDDCEDVDPKMLSGASLRYGDCLEKLKEIEKNSVDSLVTDPPAGIAFMNAEWDKDKGGRDEWISWLKSVMKECARVMKPGAHGLVWALPRTSHWTATALEDAGFEIRDVIMHLFGSGFPKSLDVSKAIDKAAGEERAKIGSKLGRAGYSLAENKADRIRYGQFTDAEKECALTAPSTPEAKQWEGWGTALKPAAEHWILIRKPLSEKTVAKNVLKWGTGGINIDLF